MSRGPAEHRVLSWALGATSPASRGSVVGGQVNGQSDFYPRLCCPLWAGLRAVRSPERLLACPLLVWIPTSVPQARESQFCSGRAAPAVALLLLPSSPGRGRLCRSLGRLPGLGPGICRLSVSHHLCLSPPSPEDRGARLTRDGPLPERRLWRPGQRRRCQLPGLRAERAARNKGLGADWIFVRKRRKPASRSWTLPGTIGHSPQPARHPLSGSGARPKPVDTHFLPQLWKPCPLRQTKHLPRNRPGPRHPRRKGRTRGQDAGAGVYTALLTQGLTFRAWLAGRRQLEGPVGSEEPPGLEPQCSDSAPN